MRPVNRTGVTSRRAGAALVSTRRAATKRGPGGVAPGRRRTTQRSKSFGRRSATPLPFYQRWYYSLRDGTYSMRPYLFGAAGLIAAATIYGLAVGGHFSNAIGAAAAAMEQQLVAAGFSVQEVNVTGRTRASRDEVLKALNVRRGDSILSFDAEAARERLERLDWVSSAVVTRLLPNTIKVELVERVPFAIWQRGGTLSVIERNGRPITGSDVARFGNLPMFVGFGAARNAADLFEILEQTPELNARVRAAVRVSNRRWNLRLENGVDVLLPETGVREALAELAKVEAANRVLGRDIVQIDLRLPDRYTVRLSPDAAARRAAALKEQAKSEKERREAARRAGDDA